MNSHKELRYRLRNIGHNNWLLGRTEVQQLPHILFDDEVVHRIITGGCPDGIAIMVATNKRLLLVDKSPFTLNVEDFPYAHITTAEYHFGFIFGALKVCTLSRELLFTRINPRKIGSFAKFVHFKIREASDTVRRLTQAIEPELMHRPTWHELQHGSQKAESIINSPTPTNLT